jgi:hypothetical protein
MKNDNYTSIFKNITDKKYKKEDKIFLQKYASSTTKFRKRKEKYKREDATIS